METYKMIGIDAATRVRFVYDETHETHGSYGYDTEEETKAAEDEETAKLSSGEWVVLGAIVQHMCGHCGEWRNGDSLWGIVVTATEDLAEFARGNLQLADSNGGAS